MPNVISRIGRRGLLKAAVFAAAVFVLAASGLLAAAPIASAESPKKGGALTVAIETDVRGFDAVEGGVLGQTGEIVMRSMMEPLITYDPATQEFGPLLATEWTLSDDKKVWTMKLREGVKFHNGEEFTAEDVAHHYNRILDPANKSRSRTFIATIEKAEVIDTHTVAFHLKHPWIPFLAYMATTSMNGPIPSKTQVEAGKQNREPVGTGPFRFVEWLGGDRIKVERNPGYWAADEINLDEITFRILPDPQTRFASLSSGDADVMWTDRGASIRKAEKDPDLTMLVIDGGGAATTLINTRNEPLNDARVRAAIAHAWNQDALVKISWQNTRPAVEHPLDPALGCVDTKYRHYDPEKAKALVAEYGKPIKLSMIHTTTARGKELGELMQQMMKAVGIELALEPVDQSTLVKRVFTKNYDISGWRIADGEIGPQLFALAHSESSYNLTGYSTPELDALALKMRVAEEVDERRKLECALAAEINEAASMLYRGGGRYYAFTAKKVKGVPAPYRGAVDVTRAWIDE